MSTEVDVSGNSASSGVRLNVNGRPSLYIYIGNRSHRMGSKEHLHLELRDAGPCPLFYTHLLYAIVLPRGCHKGTTTINVIHGIDFVTSYLISNRTTTTFLVRTKC